ncbi:MAG: hypothetical protein A2301_01340 [Candidatus Magasanikbacteria bacterium RIFOXYB2_FULL_40_13]|uniref:Uncharacterized protein n=2 Tax=Candidatus Magasanikiibacteriota TaxID=1752731 RepID=A0A1F6NFT9_9BACT|nr:MAG: hypothetical protein A2373_00595 [Candidatus Magasanikbacteria bacterium RIFOXYB1_FULL_40_15]OGH86589.1 MAG: hypothetical protein A2301_01340 [Candidatus Magasanikbacteria bacterium RIFOXYB2_FULL_40_13]OGH87229.1 MAG: hypothetical protein A2206_00850 [Candidatus Magasanikbacteria bacterium RIFOXYA1_FULL_40_8]
MKNVNEEMKDVYLRLRGYLKHAPEGHIKKPEVWNTFHDEIDELNRITDTEKYNRFRLELSTGRFSSLSEPYSYIDSSMYKGKLQALIYQLGGDDDADKQASGDIVFSPTINNNNEQRQTQAQSQAVINQMRVDFEKIIDEKIKEVPEGSDERKFLDKVKEMLKTVKSYSDILKLVLTTGTTLGLSAVKIAELLS